MARAAPGTIETAIHRGGWRGRTGGTEKVARKVDYHNLVNPFLPMKVFSDDRIEAMQEALDVLETQGIKVPLPQARLLYKAGGARADISSGLLT